MNNSLPCLRFKPTLLAVALSAIMAPAYAQSDAAAQNIDAANRADAPPASPAAREVGNEPVAEPNRPIAAPAKEAAVPNAVQSTKSEPPAADTVYQVSDEIAELIRPTGATLAVGIGHVFGDARDRALFGQYSGWQGDGTALLIDGAYVRRDEATGTWSTLDVRNLGLSNREFWLGMNKQGDWRATFAYSELVRNEPRTINTGLLGLGSTAQTVVTLPAAGAGASYTLKQERKGVTVSAEKRFAEGFLLDAAFKSEDKEGDRLFGVGNYCSNIISGYSCGTTQGALLMLVQPIRSTTQQLEINANFSGKDYLVTAGYYGSLYRNSHGSIQPGVSGNLAALDGTSFDPATGSPSLAGYLTQPIALPPDNRAHQLFVRGNYTLAPAVRSTFNLSYAQAKQNESFAGMGLPVAAGLPSSLGAEVNTTLAQLGLTARLSPDVSVIANWRYENAKDETPIATYSGTFTNTTNSMEKANGKAEAVMTLPNQMRFALGVDYALIKRDRPVSTTLIPATSMTALREQTEEIGINAEFRRPFSDSVSAALAVSHSERDGGRWMSLVPGANQYKDVSDTAIATPSGVFPSTMMDRTREKARLMIDWLPAKDLSLQVLAESGRDSFSAPTDKGLRSARMGTLGIDASYTFSYAWKFTGFIMLGEQAMNVAHGAGYIAQLDNTSIHAGVGVVGTLSSSLEVGGNFSFLSDRTRYALDAGNAVPVTGLPAVDYRAFTTKLYGKYSLSKSSDLRLDLLHQDANLDEWAWGSGGVPFTYSDNSTVVMQPNQKILFLGAAYVYRFK